MAKYYEEGGEVIMLVESVQLSWMAGRDVIILKNTAENSLVVSIFPKKPRSDFHS